jgi:hypothetical protein
VLHRSLTATHPAFTLYMFCMDDPTASYVEGLGLADVRVVSLGRLEEFDPDFARVRASRTIVEYYWTSTPVVCQYCLDHDPAAEMVTYLDADLMFFGDSRPVFEERPDASVLIVAHNFAPEWRHRERTDGIYNVQFNAFRRDRDGLRVLEWWRERCLEWCFARREDGRFGDQKYLDDWPQRFPGVHVVEHPGAGAAPWNAPGRAFTERGGEVYVDDAQLLFYHHHGIAMHADSRSLALCRIAKRLTRVGLCTGHWRTERPVPMGWWCHPAFNITRRDDSDGHRRLVWEPYWSALSETFTELQRHDELGAAGTEPLTPAALLFWAAQGAIPPRARSALRLARERVRSQEAACDTAEARRA